MNLLQGLIGTILIASGSVLWVKSFKTENEVVTVETEELPPIVDLDDTTKTGFEVMDETLGNN